MNFQLFPKHAVTGAQSRLQHIIFALVAAAVLGLTQVASADGNFYHWFNLVSDLNGVALRTDPLLVNSWGIATGGRNVFYVADNGAGVATAYDGVGTPILTASHVPLVITIPPPLGGASPSAPTGVVSNHLNDFTLTGGASTGRSVLIFVTEDGTISGWNPSVDPLNALLKVDNSASGAVYKGAALGALGDGSHFLYVANFHAGLVEVYDSTYQNVTATKFAGKFVDPSPVAGYAPFNISNISGQLLITYALQDGDKHDDVSGPGNGYVDSFDTAGNFLLRLIPLTVNGPLNSPWGMAHSTGFGRLNHALLVGNFGDGVINAFNLKTGAFMGHLQKFTGQPLAIDGLWSLVFGRGGDRKHDFDDDNDEHAVLFFAAGIGGEAHGLFGSIQPGQGDHRGGD